MGRKSNKLTDLSFLEDFTSGKKDKMLIYVNMHLESVPKMVDRLKTSLKKKDWEELHTTAHTFLPQAIYLGIKSLEQELRAIEKYARNKSKLDQLPNLVAKVETVCDKSSQELKAYMEKSS